VLLEEALNIFRELGDERGINYALRTLGRAALHQHDTERAAMLLEEALSLSRIAGSQISIAHILCLLGNIACYENNNFGRAKVLFRESLSLFQEIRDIWGIIESTLGLASVARFQKNYEQARSFYKESLTTLNSGMGYDYSVAEAIWGSGAVARAEGDYEQAQALYQKALILNKGLDKWDTAYCLAGLGGLEIAQKNPERAARLLGAAAVLFDRERDLYAADRITFDRDVGAARTQLGEATFMSAWADGQAMTLEDAIAYALENSMTATEASLSVDVDDLDVVQPQQPASQPVMDSLSERELEIVRLMAAGLSNAEIGQALYIALSTVKVHLRNIFSKLNVSSRMQAVTQAQKLHLI
jgi:ATP/maltotriose-dependent transcriptional regulator MalT